MMLPHRQIDVQVIAASEAVKEALPVVQDGVQGGMGHEKNPDPQLEPRHHRRELSVEDEYEEFGCRSERSREKSDSSIPSVDHSSNIMTES